MKIHKYEMIDHLKSGWGVWLCEVEMPDGTIRHGSVQGDEHSTAEETLEFDEPEPEEKDNPAELRADYLNTQWKDEGKREREELIERMKDEV